MAAKEAAKGSTKLSAKVSDRGVERKSDRLEGKKIGFGICGGIGAVEVVKAIRELRRHGARVIAFFTPSVPEFVGETSIEWASGEPVVTKVAADVGHLDDFDLVVVAPATMNTIAKSALALADNPVTLLVAGQLGNRAPLVFAPTMNLQLRRHPLYDEYVKRLEGWGAKFFQSPQEEDRLKMPAPERLAEFVIECLKVN